MEFIDLSKMFIDNVNVHRPQKKIVYHWTGSKTAKSAYNWLNERNEGKGSVAYNYIIDKDGKIYILCDPFKGWFHNTGLGSNYDRNTISVALVSMGANDPITSKQIFSASLLNVKLNKEFHITEITHHRHLNRKKQDFPAKQWKELFPKIWDK
jgi:hypothetical protein